MNSRIGQIREAPIFLSEPKGCTPSRSIKAAARQVGAGHGRNPRALFDSNSSFSFF
jgi:hypothetical protein